MEAFASCIKLKHIELPKNLIYIGAQAFAGSGLETITIPESVVTVNEFVFYECPNLETIYCETDIKPRGLGNKWGYGTDAHVVWKGDESLSEEVGDGAIDIEAIELPWGGVLLVYVAQKTSQETF